MCRESTPDSSPKKNEFDSIDGRYARTASMARGHAKGRGGYLREFPGRHVGHGSGPEKDSGGVA